MNSEIENKANGYTKKDLKYAKVVKSHGTHCKNCCFHYDSFKCSLRGEHSCSISITDDAHYEWNPIILLLREVAEHD